MKEFEQDKKFKEMMEIANKPSILFDGRVFVGQNHGLAYDAVVQYIKETLRGPGGLFHGLSDAEAYEQLKKYPMVEGYGDTPENFKRREDIQL